jgi:hypothetical protein
MAIRQVPHDHQANHRDDDHSDFERLRKEGLVRDKRGHVIRANQAHVDFSALDRDRLFQSYCAFMKSSPTREQLARWIKLQSSMILSARDGRAMSVKRAEDIIGQGCGAWDSKNSMWWRGVSLG